MNAEGDPVLNLSPPKLIGADVIMRPWAVDDAPALAEAWSDPDIAAGSNPPADRSVESARGWIEGAGLRTGAQLAMDLAASDPNDGRVLGEVGISRVDPVRRAALIGWWVAKDERQRGIASEAVSLVATWLLDEGGFEALLAEIDDANEASKRVAAKAGFIEIRPPSYDQPAVFVATI